MNKIKVSLSIGFNNAKHEDVIEIPEDELRRCSSAGEKDFLYHIYAKAWADNYIEIWSEEVE